MNIKSHYLTSQQQISEFIRVVTSKLNVLFVECGINTRQIRSFADYIQQFENLDKYQKRVGWDEVGMRFGMSGKTARQEFEKLRNKISQPKDIQTIKARIEDIVCSGVRDGRKILGQVKKEFNITESPKKVTNHIAQCLARAYGKK